MVFLIRLEALISLNVTIKCTSEFHSKMERNQGLSQPHGPGWARFPLSLFFLKFWSIWLIFPQKVLIFFPILALRVGDSPTEGPGYATERNIQIRL